MKILGFEIIKSVPPVQKVQDVTPDVTISVPENKKPSQIPRVLSPALSYTASRNLGRGAFVPSEYDLSEVGRIEDTESFVRQAFNKKTALMFKEGYDITGKNPKHIKYINLRLQQIASSSGISTLQLLRDIGTGLIKKSNVFILKVRKTEASGGKLRTTPEGAELEPVAGYFIAAAETMEASYSNGKIVQWRQKMPDGNIKKYKPADVIHMYYDRKEGFTFGTPTLVPVIDDIRALRKIEENIELLIYQHLFPLFQFKVGTKEIPAGVTELGEREVDVLRREIQFMPTEGGIVTTERHEITPIGAEGRALRAESYLDHFKRRVIAGLGISAIDLGDGDTANRGTADNMSRNLVDSVKDFQLILETFFAEHIINELLLESTYGSDVLDEENRVFLKFREIDIDSQIKLEAHYADQFNKGVVSLREARIGMGREPMLIPGPADQDSEDEELYNKFPDWFQTFWKLYKEPEILITAGAKGGVSASSMAAGENPSTAIKPAHVDEAHQKTVEQQTALEKIRGEAKVAAAKAMPKPPARPAAKDAFLTSRYDEVEQNTVGYLSSRKVVDHDWLSQMIRSSMSQMVDYLLANQMAAFRTGYQSATRTGGEKFAESSSRARVHLRTRAERYINRLVRDTVSALKRNVNENMSLEDMINYTHATFDTLKFRTAFIEDVEIRKSKTLGRILGLSDAGITKLRIKARPNACERCTGHSGNLLDTAGSSIDDLPPYHSSCHCYLVHPESNTQVTDADLNTLACPYCKKRLKKHKTENKLECTSCAYAYAPGMEPAHTPLALAVFPHDNSENHGTNTEEE